MSFDKVCYIGKSFLMFTSAKIAYFMLMKKNCRYYLADSAIFHIFAPHNKIPSIMNKKEELQKILQEIADSYKEAGYFQTFDGDDITKYTFYIGKLKNKDGQIEYWLLNQDKKQIYQFESEAQLNNIVNLILHGR